MRLQPLIDGDMFLYECCFALEYQRKGDDTWTFPMFDDVYSVVQNKLSEIIRITEATEPPIFFFTDNKFLAKLEGREFKPVFRKEIAKTKKYKGTRSKELPFHFYNLLITLMVDYNYVIATQGLEADDVMAMTQVFANENPDLKTATIICSRDKDLRQVPGWYFSWETNRTPSFGPIYVDSIGRLWKNSKGKVLGTGWKWFFYQLLVGDSVDNIAGCKGIGPVAAYSELEDCRTFKQMYDICLALYQKAYKKEYYYVFQEMCDLIYIKQDERSFNEIQKEMYNV